MSHSLQSNGIHRLALALALSSHVYVCIFSLCLRSRCLHFKANKKRIFLECFRCRSSLALATLYLFVGVLFLFIWFCSFGGLADCLAVCVSVCGSLLFTYRCLSRPILSTCETLTWRDDISTFICVLDSRLKWRKKKKRTNRRIGWRNLKKKSASHVRACVDKMENK